MVSSATSPVSDHDAILAVVDRFFEAYHAKDAEGMAATLTADAAGRAVRVGPDGQARVTGDRPVADVIAQLETLPEIVEVYWTPGVKVRGHLAQFWAPYVVEADGERLHCGIDAFTLVKIEGDWKLHSLDYTAEPHGCSDLGYRRDRENMRPASLVPRLAHPD